MKCILMSTIEEAVFNLMDIVRELFGDQITIGNEFLL